MDNVFGFKTGKELPVLMKQTMSKVFPEGDNIYDKSRLFREKNTINEKSGLYKIPLTLKELFFDSIEDIKLKAKAPRLDFEEHDLSGGVGKLSSMVVITPEVTKLAQKPAVTDVTNFVTCTQLMYREGPQPGSRHQIILRMASSRRRGGMPYDSVVREMQEWVPEFTAAEVERLVRSVFDTPLEYGCHDKYMAQFCSDKCAFYQHKNFGSRHHDVKDLEDQFTDFIRQDLSTSSFDIKEVFPSSTHPYRFLPGEMVIVMGDTKVGKTAFVQNLVARLSRMRTLYISTEVGAPLIYRRFVQIAHQMKKEEVENHYRMSRNSLSDRISHIKISTEPQFISEIYTSVKSVDPQIVVIDTTDGIRTRNQRDMISTSNDIALQLRELATSTKTIVIGIHHISKSGLVDPHTMKQRGLTVHSGKGSSTLEQKADKVIGIEIDNIGVRTIRSLAARDEGEFNLRCLLNPDTFVFEEINQYDSNRTQPSAPTRRQFGIV